MGYHTITPYNSSENEIIPDPTLPLPQPGKYFLVTGKDYPFCRKY